MIKPPADGLWPARTPAEVGLLLEVFGCDPSLARLVGEAGGHASWTGPGRTGKPVTYRFSIANPNADRGDFGEGTSKVLDPTDLHDQCMSLVYAVPNSPELLGPAYLLALLERLNLALACRQQIRRFLPEGAAAIPASAFHQPPPSDLPMSRAELDAIDHELAQKGQTFAAARRGLGPLPSPDELLGFEQSYMLPASERADLPGPNQPAAVLQHLLQGRWALVADALPDAIDSALLRHEDGATLRVNGTPDGMITSLSLHQGGQAMADLARYGFELTAEARLALLGALQREAPLAESEAALQGAPVQLTPITSFNAGSGRSQRFHLVEQHLPRRRSALLATLVTDSGHLVGRTLLEGVGAVDQLSRLVRRLTRDGASDPMVRALAALDEIRAAFEPELRQFGVPGADIVALSKRYRPRPGDAAAVFEPGVAPRVAQASEAIWESGEAKLHPAAGQSELTIHLAPAGALTDDGPLSKPFPGGMRSSAGFMIANRVWASVIFHRPGEIRGSRFDGFVWVEDHWAWFPKPWRMLGSAEA